MNVKRWREKRAIAIEEETMGGGGKFEDDVMDCDNDENDDVEYLPSNISPAKCVTRPETRSTRRLQTEPNYEEPVFPRVKIRSGHRSIRNQTCGILRTVVLLTKSLRMIC